MSATTAHLAALRLIKNIAEGSSTANSLPHIAKIAASAIGNGVTLDPVAMVYECQRCAWSSSFDPPIGYQCCPNCTWPHEDSRE